jgi:hypothetical protein
MAWQSLGIVNLSKDWSFTIPVTAEIFRIKHTPIILSKKDYLKAVVAQGFIDDFYNIFDTRRLTYREGETEMFQFQFPLGLDAHSLFFKRLDDSPINWSIEVETFVSSDIEKDFLDYLTTRFGDFMPLFSRAIFNEAQEPEFKLWTSSNSGDKEVTANTVTMLLDETAHRRVLTIQNKSLVSVSLGTAANAEDNLITQEVIVLQPNEYYEFPAAGNEAYTGQVWAKAPAAVTLQIVEMIREAVIEGNGYND